MRGVTVIFALALGCSNAAPQDPCADALYPPGPYGARIGETWPNYAFYGVRGALLGASDEVVTATPFAALRCFARDKKFRRAMFALHAMWWLPCQQEAQVWAQRSYDVAARGGLLVSILVMGRGAPDGGTGSAPTTVELADWVIFVRSASQGSTVVPIPVLAEEPVVGASEPWMGAFGRDHYRSGHRGYIVDIDDMTYLSDQAYIAREAPPEVLIEDFTANYL